MRSRSRRVASALRLALALPLVCVLLLGSLWIGQELRSFRSPAATTPTPAPMSQVAAGKPRQQPVQRLEVAAHLDVRTGLSSVSPDGAYLVARTDSGPNQGAKLVFARILHERDRSSLKTEVIFTAGLSFVAWLPGSGTFLATSGPLPPVPGEKPRSKVNEVSVVSPTGSRRVLSEPAWGPLVLSPDATAVATFDGDLRLMILPLDGGPARVVDDPTAGSSPALIGWDAQDNLLRADYREPFSVWKIPLAGGAPTRLRPAVKSVSNGRWSPDRSAAIVTVSTPSEYDGLLVGDVAKLPAGALPTWVGPHSLLVRGADERAGTLDVISGVRTTLGAKLRGERIRVLAVSSPYVLWLDEAKGLAHLLDLAGDRDTGLGLDPAPSRALALSGGRFAVWREDEILILDGAAWWATVPATPTPVPNAKDQSAVPDGYVRVMHAEGGWSVFAPKDWYRRAAPMRGTDFSSYDTIGMDYSGNFPPPGGALVSVQAMPDHGVTDLRDFARAEYLRRSGTTILSENEADATLDGRGTREAYVVDVEVNGPGSGSLTGRGTIRYWFERSPYFSDRIVVITARPIDAHATEVALLMKSLTFLPPVVAPQTPTARAAVIARYTATAMYRRIDAVEAKLVTWKEYEDAAAFGRSYTNDPDQLVWVVLVTGEIDPPMSGPIGRPSPGLVPYVVNILDGVTGDAMGFGTGPGARPGWFDSLRDAAAP